MNLSILEHTFCICRLNPNDPIPDWVNKKVFWAITQTQSELSLLCQDHPYSSHFKSEGGWKILKVEGTLDFSLTGILSSILNPLAESKISIFAVSTFDTDYILVKEDRLVAAREALEKVGFAFC